MLIDYGNSYIYIYDYVRPNIFKLATTQYFKGLKICSFK